MAVATIVANIWDLRFAILRGCSHDSCVPQNAFPKVRGYNRALACVRSCYACHPTLCIRYRIQARLQPRPSVDGLMHEHIFYARLQPRPSVDGHL